MKKITDFIVEKRNLILIIFLIITAICLFLIPKVNINYDIAKYLPSDSPTRVGMDIMESDFKEIKSSTLNIMFENLSKKEKNQIYKELTKIENVSNVDYDQTKNYNKDNYTLYVVNVSDTADSKIAKQVYEDITSKYKNEKFETSGDVAEQNKPVLHLWIIITAIVFAMIILIIMCDSYVEPFLFLFVIGLAVIVNYGTNIWFESVSNITNSICAILQMALSMDYSIMLMNRYTQEKEKSKDKVEAMKNALSKAFGSISSSSVTTIVGLLALIFMSFTIGRDLGFVLAKGVLLSLISIFLCLPALILMFDSLITKTKKKSINFNLTKLGKFSFNLRYPALGIFIILFVASYFLKGNLGILYTDSETDKVGQVFSENNQMAIIYDNKYEKEISKLCKNLENNKKIDQVLCYGNTINEKLTYDNLNNKFKKLGQDVNIDDYLLKIIYYNYYNKDNDPKMTFNEFIQFIKNNIYTKETLNIKISDDIKNNIDILSNFTTKENLDKQRTAGEIANILGISEDEVKSLFVLYNSKQTNTTISITDLINFINNDVLTNETYKNSIDNSMKQDLNKLSKLTNVKTINRKMTSKEIAELFNIDNNLTDSLYLYYTLNNNINYAMDLNTFANFVLNDVSKNSTYKNLLTDETKRSLKVLQTFSNKNLINKKMSYQEIAKLLNMDENNTKQLLLFYYLNQENSSTYSLTDFINRVTEIKNNTKYLDDTDVSNIVLLNNFTKNDGALNKVSLTKDQLATIFDSSLVNLVYTNIDSNKTMTTKEFVSFTLNNFSNYLDDTTTNNLKLISAVIDDTLSAAKVKYSTTTLSTILNVDKNSIDKLYNLIDFSTNNTDKYTISCNDLVKFILTNKDDSNLSSSLTSDLLEQLNLLNNIMNATNSNMTFNYQQLAELLNMDSNTTKSVYALYTYSNTKITPKYFISFILNHKNDTLLKNKISSKTLKELNLADSFINGVLNNKKYSISEISNILNIDNSKVSLIYSLYDINSNANYKVSLNSFISFICNDVLNDNEYKNLFDEDSKTKLITINGIKNATLNNTKYTSGEITGLLNSLTNKIDSNLIDLLYIYYGSDNYYKDDYKLTVEEFVNYLNNDILKDKRFSDFIDSDIKYTIKNAKKSINEAKELLVSKKYSRAILNTKYDSESKETFDFIKSIQDNFKDKDDIYVIGDSLVAYDMSQSFDSELNYITILTMIAIFIVVAITFKSIIIPLILVLIIQCAVFITMGLLSLMGGEVYFIALLIVQSILMGATIDYAILYTSYYKEFRTKMNIKESLINAYNKSIHTILTSASILIIVTLIVGYFASAIAAKICKTISQGTMCSLILVLFILPPILAACDKLIIKKHNYKK